MPTAMMTPLLRHLHKLAGADERFSDAELLHRFGRDQDGHAFRLLVQRHGPMVLGICRRALGASPDCEDAFQATFLVLVRKAKRIRRPKLLGNWLFGVARRIALRARSRSMRESLRRRPLDDRFIAYDGNQNRNDGVSEIIDAAVARLPTKYRVPIVLCYLQGHSQAGTAARLGCAVSTISTRIARAKARLRSYLIRQGMTAASATCLTTTSSNLLTAAVPAQMAIATRSAAIALSGGGAGAIPLSILALTKGIGDAMILQSWKLVGTALVALVASGTGVSLCWLSGGGKGESSTVAVAPQATNLMHRMESLPSDALPKPLENADRSPFQYASENFAISNVGDAEGRVIVDAAEGWRSKLAVQWLGKELPNWPKRCPIVFRLEDGGSSGATTINFDFKGGVEFVSMKLNGSLATILGNNLPHEVMHTVLATHFARPLPRWADEGVAVLTEGTESVNKHEAVLNGLMQKNQHVPLRRLLSVKENNEVPNVMLLYAQGASVVRFLVERKDKPTFLKFLASGMKGDWQTAAKEAYDFASIEAVETAWLKDLEQRKNASDPQPNRELKMPPGVNPPPPHNSTPPMLTSPSMPSTTPLFPYDNRAHVVKAVIDDEGRLVLKFLAPIPGHPSSPPPMTPREEAVRRFSILDARGCLVKNHRLDEVELRRFAGLLRAERVVIVAYVDGPREELENLLLIAQDDTIVLLLPRPK